MAGLLAASAVFVLAGFIRAMVFFGGTSGPFILHFNDLEGIISTGGTGVVIFVGLFGIAMVLVNGCLAVGFADRIPFLSKLTAILTLVFAVLLFIAFTAILGVN